MLLQAVRQKLGLLVVCLWWAQQLVDELLQQRQSEQNALGVTRPHVPECGEYMG